jgi:hypothetical protein
LNFSSIVKRGIFLKLTARGVVGSALDSEDRDEVVERREAVEGLVER